MNISLKKLSRAADEIQRLEEFIADVTRQPCNKAALRARRRQQKYEIYISTTPDIEQIVQEVSITVGVVAHLLRSSLDNLAFYLAQKNTHNNIQRPKSIQFPISDARDSYEKSSSKQLAEISEKDKKVICSYQPFHGIAGRPDSYSGPYIHQLSLLRDISNSDKHREVVEVLIDPNHFEFNKASSPIVESWSEWTKSNPCEYFNTFKPPVMRVGEIIQQPVSTTEFLGEEFEAGFALINFALSERRPLVPTLQRVSEFVETVLTHFVE